MCPKCLFNAIQEQRKTNNQAIKIAKEMNLVDLMGTEKQVEWANVLRLKILDRVDNLIKKEKDKDKDKKIILEKFHEDLITNPSASFWIKHRNDNLKTWINRTLKRGLLGEEHINIKYE